MKAIVIYNSQTGFTKRYAEWIAEAIKCESVAYKAAKQLDLKEYDTVLFGSWCHAGRILKISWLKELMSKQPDKKYVVFAVGASPAGIPDIDKTIDNNLPEEYRKICKAFYCPGGLCYERMSMANHLLMKAFARMLSSKKDKTEDEAVMSGMVSKNFDISDIKYTEQIIDCLR